MTMIDSVSMRYSHITENSLVDGPGLRITLFFQGCSLECPGCQNKAIWPFGGGIVIETAELAQALVEKAPHGNFTLMGGEPFDQPAALLFLLRKVRELKPDAHIIVYSGYTWEALERRYSFFFSWIAQMIDVLVDGPFIASQDDSLLTYRGSRNQRPIDVPATLATGTIVTLDWDSPEIIIDTNGNLHMPIGLAAGFAEAGNERVSRRCGQINQHS
jgi:anaerobic ribonucleoside-triphosphate reductase activating protein